MARREEPESSGGCPEWLATYGDLVTLLLCFFVLLFASSSISAEKFKQIADSFSGNKTSLIDSSGGSDGLSELLGSGILDLPDVDKSINKTREEKEEKKNDAAGEIQRMATEFKTYFADNDLTDRITIEVSEQYISLNLPENILFDPGKADIKSDALDILAMIGEALEVFSESNIIVEGHTDNVPISTVQYKNNWYLASARANEVVMYFVDTMLIDPVRIKSTSNGEYHPIDTNATAEGRARNRRVEIRIMSNLFSDYK